MFELKIELNQTGILKADVIVQEKVIFKKM